MLFAPSDLVATVISSSRIDLTWKNNDAYDVIRIFRGKGDNEAAAIAALVQYSSALGSAEYWGNSGLESDEWYAYKIFAHTVHPYEASDFSNTDTGETPLTLAAPTLVVATPISGIEIDLTFKDNSSDEKWHRVERKLGAGAYATVVDLEPNREFFRDGGLFLLAAGYTDCVETDIGKQVQDDGGEIGLLVAYDNTRRRWLIDSNGHTIANAESMSITAGTGAGTAARATTSLIASSLYTYKVHAMQAEGDYDVYDSESAQVTTFDVPVQVTLAAILAADTKDKSIRIRWTDLANETGYRIEMSKTGDLPFDADEGDLIAIVGAGVTDFLATGLDVGTAYSFQVRAYNAAGNGAFSVTRAATTDAAYVPTEFEKWIRDPNIEPVYLAEIYTKMTLTGFVVHDDPCYKKTIGASDRGIDILEVFEDSVAYTEQADAADVKANVNSFWFDYANRILYVHATGGVDPDNLDLIEGAFWLYFSTHKDIEFTVASGRLHHYLPLLAKEDIPDITQEIKPYFEGSFAISSGSIAFMNAKIMGEHFFDEKFATYTWINAKVILKAGSDSFTYAQFKEIFTSYIDSKSCSDAKITFQLRDMRKEMSQSLILNKFNTTDYPDIEDTFVGKPIPIAFGGREEAVPVPIDVVNQKYKFNDSTIATRSGEVSLLTKNDVELIEDTHYYIDLQRSIITFERDGRFVIEEDVNDMIDFREGVGVELHATLDPGIYTTAELCAEIKRVMDIAGGFTYTIGPTAIPATPPKNFTIASGAEADVFNLLWKTGTSGAEGTNEHVGTTIGFSDDEDGEGGWSYEADEDVITIDKGDIIKVSFKGFVNSADEVIDNGAEIFKYLMNNYKGITDSELNLDSIYATKYAKTDALTLAIESEASFDEIVRTIEHSMEAYTFQDEFGRLGIKPQQTVAASNVKYIISKHIFNHGQSKDKSTLFWKVNVYYNKDYDDNWLVTTATKNEIYWQYGITEELPIYTYFKDPTPAVALAASILNLLNKEQIENTLSMLLFDVMAGDLIKFSRVRFYDTDGTASEIDLRMIRISKSPASGKTSITAEVV